MTETRDIRREEVETAPVKTEFTELGNGSQQAYDEYVERLKESLDEYVEHVNERDR